MSVSTSPLQAGTATSCHGAAEFNEKFTFNKLISVTHALRAFGGETGALTAVSCWNAVESMDPAAVGVIGERRAPDIQRVV
jgi:hypothetical protein